MSSLLAVHQWPPQQCGLHEHYWQTLPYQEPDPHHHRSSGGEGKCQLSPAFPEVKREEGEEEREKNARVKELKNSFDD